MKSLLRQRCTLALLYANWLLFLAVAIYLGLTRRFLLLGVWVVVAPPALIGYVRVFPRISSLLGYGSVADEAAASPAYAPARVTMYTGVGCPFCPIVEKRLRSLQPAMGFELEVVEVTARPELARRERIGSVPLVVVGGRRHAGCATTRELAQLIADAAPATAPAAG